MSSNPAERAIKKKPPLWRFFYACDNKQNLWKRLLTLWLGWNIQVFVYVKYMDSIKILLLYVFCFCEKDKRKVVGYVQI